MIIALCTPAHRDSVIRALPTNARVTVNSTEFMAGVRGSACLVMVLESLTEHEAELRDLRLHLVRCPQVGMVVATRLDAANVELLADVGCRRVVDIDRLESDLPAKVNQTLVHSPRHLAAAGLLSRERLSPLTIKVVEEVLLADTAVHDVGDLSLRLDRPRHQIQRTWKRDIRPYVSVSLHSFLKWGRRLRAAEWLRGGLHLTEVAVRLGVDESTIYRDFRGCWAEPAQRDCDIVTITFLKEFNLIGGPVVWSRTNLIADLFRLAGTLSRFAFDALVRRVRSMA